MEIGPGAGLATRRLLERGASPMVAVEPDPRLAAFLQDQHGPALDVRCASFEGVDLPAGSFDLAVAATSFHWVDPEVGVRKVARLLRPGGWWAMCWNVFGDPSLPDPFHEATLPILDPLDVGSAHQSFHPPYAPLNTAVRVAELEAVGQFEDIQWEVVRWAVTFDTARLRALYATYSSITRLHPAERDRILDAVCDVADRQFGGQVERRMTTPIYTARRR